MSVGSAGNDITKSGANPRKDPKIKRAVNQKERANMLQKAW
jgi:hypothetical protein